MHLHFYRCSLLTWGCAITAGLNVGCKTAGLSSSFSLSLFSCKFKQKANKMTPVNKILKNSDNAKQQQQT